VVVVVAAVVEARRLVMLDMAEEQVVVEID
jgi:hypothetical protein